MLQEPGNIDAPRPPLIQEGVVIISTLLLMMSCYGAEG